MLLFSTLVGPGFLASGSAAERKPGELVVAPPPAQPLTVEVKRGETVEIALRIFGRKNETLRYLVRTGPQHGKVSAPKIVEREVSTVIYTPPSDISITRDRFTYAVQNSAGVSAAVPVDITIIDLPPVLALPEAQDFGIVQVGETATKAIEVRNRGGGLAEGKVEVGEPWKIQGAATYRLGAGEKASFKVVFAPASGGTHDSAIRFSSQPDSSVLIKGAGLAELAATPEKLLLQNAEGDPMRFGSFDLSNNTAKERRVRLSGGERLEVFPEVAIPPKGKVTVTVQAKDVSALNNEVRVESDGFSLQVPVIADAVRGIIRAKQTSVSFGRVSASKGGEANVELENVGGQPARVSWEIAAQSSAPQPFTAQGNASGSVLAPGGKLTIPIRVQAAEPRKYRGALLVMAGPRLEIPLEAELIAENAAPALMRASNEATPPASTPPAPSPATRAADEPARADAPLTAPAVVQPVVPQELLVELNRPKGAGLKHVDGTSATLEWPAALSSGGQFAFERRRVVPDGEGGIKVQWEPLTGWTVEQTGAVYTAKLTKLRSGEMYGVRVLAVSPEGSKPLFTQYFATTPRPRLLPEITLFRVLVLALIVCGALIWRQRRARNAAP